MRRKASPPTTRSGWRSSKESEDPVNTDLFINNEWRPAASGKRFPVVNPATEEVIAEVAAGDAGDVDNAVAAARTCFESDAWRNLSARKRGRLLAKAADLLEGRLEEIARLETAHNGKTLFESKIEITMTVNTLRYYAGWADKITGDTLPVDGPFLVYTLREPIGVVGAIVPWNFPLNIASWKFAPALAAGCTVVLKPASETPLTALAFAELVLEAGFPPGAFNVVTGGGSTAGAALVRHPDVDKISFTGSTEVGRQIMRMAAETNKRVTLELGGKSPNIIFADADLKAAVRGAQTGIFYGKGEVCAAGSRLLVERSVHDQVVEQLAEGAKKLTPGDPLDKNTRLGALVSKRQQETVLGYIKKGVAEGAALVAGGKAVSPPPNGKGYFVEATVFDQVSPEMTIAREEIFGPVLAVLSFDDFEQGVKLANQSMYGLAAGIWTKDIQKAHRAARAIRAGTVWINAYNFYDSGAPFGGFKASGFGRDLGKEALDGYTEVKTVWVGL
ncbi:MAG: aldehyde dehydrogenase family protein [Gemmatimonadetes bacterium]|nr:aldehyde dehydrogenase family protein [Gemmatimonadota bacterium]